MDWDVTTQGTGPVAYANAVTREDIECIIKWFSHIEQLATDGKTANNFQMPIDKILATIKVVAKDSREYVEKFCNDSVSKDSEEAAKEYARCHYADTFSQELAENDFLAGSAWKEMRMMKEAVEATLDNTAYPTRLWFNTYLSEYSNNDKVRVIIVKEDEK